MSKSLFDEFSLIDINAYLAKQWYRPLRQCINRDIWMDVKKVTTDARAFVISDAIEDQVREDGLCQK